MILWRVASAVFLFRWVFRDPKVDYRFLVAGALVPDVVDLAIGTVLVPSLATGELIAHSLPAPSLAAVVVLLATRRGRRRRAWMAFVVGWLVHLLVDGMWTNAEVFFWPLFGWGFTPGEAPFWPLAWQRALADPLRWVLEAAGLAYLVVLWRRHGLGDPEVRARLAATGRLD